MEKIVNKIVGILYVLSLFLHHIITKKASNTTIVNVIFWPQGIRELSEYIFRGYLLQDYVLLKALENNGYKTKVLRRGNIVSIPKGSVVCYSMTKCTRGIRRNPRISQGESLYEELLELSFLRLFPHPLESRIWENKAYMHSIFEEREVKSPQTVIVSDLAQIQKMEMKFPVLTKLPNANQSKGIDMHSDVISLKQGLEVKLIDSETVLVQELKKIEFDIRVVVIAGEVVYHYWRYKNNPQAEEFTTTSTVNGGHIDIKPLPLEVLNECKVAANNLNLSMAAFDVTYLQENGRVQVIFFEVSPSFILNPIPLSSNDLEAPYKNYKAKFLKFNRELVKQFISIKQLQVKSWNI